MIFTPAAPLMSKTPATIGYLGNQTSNTDGASYSWSSQTLGAVTSDRRIILVTAASGAYTTVTSATIAGVSATPVTSTYAHNQFGIALGRLWVAHVPSGTSGTISFTLGATVLRGCAAWWRMTGATDTAYDTDGHASSPRELTNLTIPNKGIGVGCWFCDNQGEDPGGYWSSGLTEDFNVYISDGFCRFVGGSSTTAGTEVRDISGVTLTNASDVIFGASWEP